MSDRDMLIRLAIALLLSSLAFAGRDRAHGQSAPVLSVDPPAQTVALGDGAFEVRLLIDDVTNAQGLGGYTLLMTYDPLVLRAQSVDDSGFIASTGNASFCPSSVVDNDSGDVALFCLTIPIFAEPGPQAAEPQVLTRIVFEPLADGVTVLDISGSNATDPQGNDLGSMTINGQVTVSIEATPGEGPDSDGGPSSGQESTRDAGNSALPNLGAGPGPRAGGAGAWAAWGLMVVGLMLASVGYLARAKRLGRSRRYWG